MEMGGNFCKILELGGTTIKGRRALYIQRKRSASQSIDQSVCRLNNFLLNQLCIA